MAREVNDAARQELLSALIALPFIIVAAIAAWYFLSPGKDVEVESGVGELSMPAIYPGPWITEIRGDISSTLARNRARGCGVYAYKRSVNSPSEFLVYCSPDGMKDWTVYQVWPSINEIIGPMLPHPEIPPPNL